MMKRIFRNTSFLLFGTVANKILALIFLAVIARFLGPDEFGKYSFAISFTAICLVLGDLGLNAIAVREVSPDRQQAQKYLGNIVLAKILLSGLAVILVLIIFSFIRGYPPETRKLVYVVGISVFFSSVSSSLRWIFQAFQKMEWEAMINVLHGIAMLGTGFILLYLGFGVIGLGYAYLFTSVGLLLFSYLIVSAKFVRPRLEVDFNLWKSLLKMSVPIGVTTIFASLYLNVDTVMLSLMKNDSAVGFYNAGHRLIEVVKLIPANFAVAVFPAMSDCHRASSETLTKLLRKSMQYMFIIAFPLIVVTVILAYRIIPLVCGDGFGPAVYTLQILIWGGGMAFFSCIGGWCLYAIGRQRIPMYACAAGLVVNVILNFFLIPRFSHIGAAVAIVVAEVLVTTLTFIYIFKFVKVNPFPPKIPWIILASLIMGVAVWLVRDRNIFFAVCVAVIVYLGALQAMGVLSFKKIRVMCASAISK
jgi:O-antigen/teichoic acid export membrane protein